MEEERKRAKKMTIVAFWYIQLKPTYLPSIIKVVEMLEGNVETSKPPKPFLSPREIPVEDHGININPIELSISSGTCQENEGWGLHWSLRQSPRLFCLTCSFIKRCYLILFIQKKGSYVLTGL